MRQGLTEFIKTIGADPSGARHQVAVITIGERPTINTDYTVDADQAIKGVNRTLMMEVGKSRHDLHGTPFDRWHDESNLIDCQPGWVSLPAVASGCGLDLAYRGPKDVMAEIANTNEAFSGVSYEAMGESGVRLREAAQTA